MQRIQYPFLDAFYNAGSSVIDATWLFVECTHCKLMMSIHLFSIRSKFEESNLLSLQLFLTGVLLV